MTVTFNDPPCTYHMHKESRTCDDLKPDPHLLAISIAVKGSLLLSIIDRTKLVRAT